MMQKLGREGKGWVERVVQEIHVITNHCIGCKSCAYHDGLLAVRLHDSDLPREHPQLLEVDQPVNLGLGPVIQECQVFLDDGEEGDQRGVGASLKLAVLGHVVKRG